MIEDYIMDENNDFNENEESFEALLDSYSQGMDDDIREGDKIKGEVISVGSGGIFVDTGTKTDGFVDKSEFLDDYGEVTVQRGDLVELYVVSVKENEITLSKAVTGEGGKDNIRTAFDNSVPVEGKVSSEVKGGFQLDINGIRAFCPVSQMDTRRIDNLSEYVGNSYRFLVTKFEEGGRNIVVSRRELLSRESEEEKKIFLEKLEVGAELEGVVSSIQPYGAFVELMPGLEGLVHISELGWSRVQKAEEVVQSGDAVKVKVIGIEKRDDGKTMKLSLSIKQISDDPWELAKDNFHVGDNLTGKVTRCTDFGAFVEIVPGTEGLVHISEMSYTKRVHKPEDVVTLGESVQVVIKDIDTVKKRISLSIRDAQGDPWSDAAEKYKIGASVEGTVEKKENFGWFVTLEPGITGLLPKSDINRAENPKVLDRIKLGENIKLSVKDINTSGRKITLTLPDNTGGDEWKSYVEKKDSSMGELGELLQQAMKKKS